MKVFVKVNVGDIIKSHFSTLVHAKKRKPGRDDYFTFLLFPLLICLIVSFLGVSINSTGTNIIITSLAIFVGLLINMVVLLFDLLGKDTESDEKVKILREILSNILFTILLSIFLIILSLVGLIPDELMKNPCIKHVSVVIDGIIYFFLTFLILTILMVIKRMYLLFDYEFRAIEDRKRIKKEKEDSLEQ